MSERRDRPSTLSRIGDRLRQQGFAIWGSGGHVADVLHDEYGATEERLREKIRQAETISERIALRKKYTYADFQTTADLSEGIGNWTVRGTIGLTLFGLIIPGVRERSQHGYIDFGGRKLNLPERNRRVDYRTASWGNILREGGIRTLAANLDGIAKALGVSWSNPVDWKGTSFEEEWDGFRELVDLLATEGKRRELKEAMGDYMKQLLVAPGSVLDYTGDVDKLGEWQRAHGIEKMDLPSLKQYSSEELEWNEDDWNVFEAIYFAKERDDTQIVISDYLKRYPSD